MKTKNGFKFLVLSMLILIFLVGVILINYSSKSNEYMDGKIYFLNFGLMKQDFIDESNNKIHVQDFCFYYDFTKNKGNISFNFPQQDWFLSYIDVEFPSLIKSKTLNIYSIKDGIKTDCEADIEITEHQSVFNGINFTHLEISNFKRIFNDEKFVIEFESNLQPNGNFIFTNNFYNVLHSDDKQGNVNFVLGDDYECVGDCVYNLKFIEETLYSSDRNLKFKFIESERQDKKLKINAVNRKIKWEKTFYLGLGISFIVAALNSIFLIVYENNKTNSNLKKRELEMNETINEFISFLKKYKLSLLLAFMIIIFIIISVVLFWS